MVAAETPGTTPGVPTAHVEDLLTSDELAEILRLRPTTLANWRSASRGPAYFRIEGTVRYRISDVEKWLKNRHVETLETVRLPRWQHGH